MLVYLSPSDQHSNIVADGSHSEADHCKNICVACAKYLQENGYYVKIGDNVKEGSYVNRTNESNNLHADLHIPVHTNAGGGQGTLVMTYPGYASNKYATSIYNEVANLTPTKDYGIRERSDLYEINETSAMCVYIEVEFHDNLTLDKWIDSNIDAIGKAIATGILKGDGKTINQPSPTTTALYHVQVGAFSQKANAEKLANELKSKGYDTYITRG